MLTVEKMCHLSSCSRGHCKLYGQCERARALFKLWAAIDEALDCFDPSERKGIFTHIVNECAKRLAEE